LLTKIDAVLLVPYWGLWLLFYRRCNGRAWLVYLFSLPVALVVLVAGWPWIWANPVAGLAKWVKFFEESHKVFIYVIDDQGTLLAQTDNRSRHYASNANRWIPGQVVYDRFAVQLKPGTPAGRHQVCVGPHNEADGQRLPALDAARTQVDDQVLLGYQELPRVNVNRANGP
jgi:hypothetical protein